MATVSASIMWAAEGKAPNEKTIGRDVILGIILFFVLFQLLPESTTTLITSILSFIPSPNDEIIPDAILPSSDDMEVRVGVPKF